MPGTRLRLFLTAWIVYSVHFATNVVREHYPAFSLAEHGTFRVDEYYVENPDAPGRSAFHCDIFLHRDGHAYIGNNVAASVIAALPLFVFDPLLDYLEEAAKRRRAAGSSEFGEYDSKQPNRQKFWEALKEQGLELRFGAATAITTVFLMAPLSALAVVLMFQCLNQARVSSAKAVWLSLLFAFGTPLFFRTGHLGNNLMVMYATFAAFYLLRPENAFPVNLSRRMLAGFLCGAGLAFDYSGVVPLLAFYGYLGLNRLRTASFWTSFRESLAFVLGSVPPVLFLLYSQWAMYGNPFLPGQYWMPAVDYTDRGWRGYDWPAADLFFQNLFEPSYGLFAFGPVLLLAFVPAFFRAALQVAANPAQRRVLAPAETLFIHAYTLAFLVFCAANQYSRMQWNSGFRYLIPLVPLLYLAACEHLVRLPGFWLGVLSVPLLLHSWVISMVRDTSPEGGYDVVKMWQHFFSEGVQLPWLNVLRRASPPDHPVFQHPWLPMAVLGIAAVLVALLWLPGRKPAPPIAPAAS